MLCEPERRAEKNFSSAEREKGKKQSAEEGASSGASGADDELLNTKDLNFFGDASVIKYAPTCNAVRPPREDFESYAFCMR